MAEIPHSARRPRPLSPHVFHYSWPVTMATSIIHRVTGVGLGFGTLLLAWWLTSIARGPDAFNQFNALAATPLGQVILFGFVWALSYHLVNGIRHLVWDVGYGFSKPVARLASVFVLVVSAVLAIAFFALAYTGQGGFYQ